MNSRSTITIWVNWYIFIVLNHTLFRFIAQRITYVVYFIRTKKINNTNELWEAIDNPQSAADEVTQHEAYRDALTTQYGEATRDTEADKVRK